MHVMLRLLLLPGVLSAGAALAHAESILPDPVAPAVIGRPLDQIKPVRPQREKRAAAKAQRPKAVAAKPAAAQVARTATPASPHLSFNQTAGTNGGGRVAKQALDDRADERMQLNEVGKGQHFARKPLGPGAYFASRHRNAVRRYYAEHPAAGAAPMWRIGEPVPRGASLAAVPKGLLANLPEVPPGHRYVQLGGEVVLIAAQSRMVVDGISRAAR